MWRQETRVEEYRNLFDKLKAPLSNLQDRVIEETFMNGLLSWIKAKVDFCRPTRLAQMMQVAQLVENQEIIWVEANLKGYSKGKYPPHSSTVTKSSIITNPNENKGNTTFLMRTITLRGVANGETKEGPMRRLSDAEFQARKEKGLCFRCDEKYSHDHKCKMKDQKELQM